MKEIHLTSRLANTKGSCGFTYIRSNRHMCFIIFSQLVMNQALKFRLMALFWPCMDDGRFGISLWAPQKSKYIFYGMKSFFYKYIKIYEEPMAEN